MNTKRFLVVVLLAVTFAVITASSKNPLYKNESLSSKKYRHRNFLLWIVQGYQFKISRPFLYTELCSFFLVWISDFCCEAFSCLGRQRSNLQQDQYSLWIIMLISNAVDVLTLKSSYWIPLTWKTFIYYASSVFFGSVWRTRFTLKSATIKIIKEIPSLNPVTKKSSSIIHSDDVSFCIIGIGLTQMVRKVLGFPIYFAVLAEENYPRSRRGGGGGGGQKRGSPCSCSCSGGAGVYWWPTCPGGWRFWWAVTQVTGQCCIKGAWVLHGQQQDQEKGDEQAF